MIGGVLPLELGGETMAGPTCVGVGLEEAEVADGSFAEVVERAEAMHGVNAPARVGGVVALPVERGLPAFGAHGGPSLGEPELGAVVAVLVDEGEVLGAGDEARGEAVGRNEDGVTRGLVIEGEGVGGCGVEGEADVGEAGGEVDPAEWRRDGFGLLRCGFAVSVFSRFAFWIARDDDS